MPVNLMAFTLVLAVGAAIAAEPFRPLGVGFNDIAYGEAWEKTVANLKALGYVRDKQHVAVQNTGGDLYAAYWRAHVLMLANGHLKRKRLKPVPLHPLYAGTEPYMDTLPLMRDQGRQVFAAQPQAPLGQPGYKHLEIEYRVTTGAIVKLWATFIVALDGPDAKDPVAIGTTWYSGLISTCPGSFSTQSEIGRSRALVNKRNQDVEATRKAVGEVLESRSEYQKLSLCSSDDAANVIGSLDITQRNGKHMEFSLYFLFKNRVVGDGCIQPNAERFQEDVVRTVAEEVRRQATDTQPPPQP